MRRRRFFLLCFAAAFSLLPPLLLLLLVSNGGGGADDAAAKTQAPDAGVKPDVQSPLERNPQKQQPPPGELTRLEQLPSRCSQPPCIGFGTPYFSDWAGWMPYVRQWVGSASAACGVACEVVSDPDAAHAVLFHGRDLAHRRSSLRRGRTQRWVYLNMESPLATRLYGYDVAADPNFRFAFNWSATTMLSSSVHQPYGMWDRRDTPLQGPLYSPSRKRHLAYVAFSNCKHAFNGRTAKVAELRRHMEIHVYGECGDRPLVKDWNVWRSISEQYRFYLSFENAFCRDYITEKFHNNGLDSQAVPVAFGGLARAEYERVSPPNSFIYALDFDRAEQLAGYLKALAADEGRYASYLEWKRQFRVSSRTALLCGVCARLHNSSATPVRTTEDLSDFYDVKRNCRPPDFAYLT